MAIDNTILGAIIGAGITPATAFAIYYLRLRRQPQNKLHPQLGRFEEKDIWKITFGTAEIPIERCTVDIGDDELVWDGNQRREFNMGAGGAGNVSVPSNISPFGKMVHVKHNGGKKLRSELFDNIGRLD